MHLAYPLFMVCYVNGNCRLACDLQSQAREGNTRDGNIWKPLKFCQTKKELYGAYLAFQVSYRSVGLFLCVCNLLVAVICSIIFFIKVFFLENIWTAYCLWGGIGVAHL